MKLDLPQGKIVETKTLSVEWILHFLSLHYNFVYEHLLNDIQDKQNRYYQTSYRVDPVGVEVKMVRGTEGITAQD